MPLFHSSLLQGTRRQWLYMDECAHNISIMALVFQPYMYNVHECACDVHVHVHCTYMYDVILCIYMCIVHVHVI